MKKNRVHLFSFLLGGFLLCCLSLLQKIIIGFQFSIHGFYIPFFAGGGFGLLIGIRHNKILRTNEQLSEEIDKRENTEAALRESEAKYKDLYEHAPDMHFSIDFETTKIIACNDAVVNNLGYTEDEILGQSCLDIYTPDSADFMKTVVLPNFIKTGMIENEELKLKKKDGNIIDVNLRATAVYDKQGRLLYSRSVWHDITYRKRLDRQIRLMQHWIENSVDLFFWVREDSKIIYVNKAVCDYLGYTLEELCNMKVSDIDLTIQLGDWHDFANKLIKYDSHCFESRLRKKDGQIIDLEITANIITYEGDDHFFAYGRDISDKIAAEGKRNDLEKKLRQAHKMEAIGTLAGGIAHDFNNILSAVIGYNDLLQMQLPEHSKEYDYTLQIQKAGIRAKDLVKQILTFSRQSDQELRPVELSVIVKEVAKLLRSSLPTTIEIKQNIQSSHLVMADPTQLHQVIMNLCTNAGHAMQEKGGLLAIDLKNIVINEKQVRDQINLPPANYVHLSVSDTGHGIPSDVIGRVFDPFFTTKKRGEGTGMGLSVVHGIVESYKGAVSVSSEPGDGSTFQIYLPAIERRVETKKHRGEDIPRGTEHILFIDDEPILVEMGTSQLESLGYRVSSRSNSIEALALFKTKPDSFDLIITDMTMPKMTGDELAKEIRRVSPDIPIILSTGFSSKINPENVNQLDIDAFLMKPVIISEMARVIRKTLDC